VILTDRFEIWPKVDAETQHGKPLFGATEARCLAWVEQRPDAHHFAIQRAAACSCCGAVNDYGIRNDIVLVADRLTTGPLYRCAKHRESNPCAVDGCARTRGAARYYNDRLYLCAEHWKLACPPRSSARAVYNRLFKLKRQHSGKDGTWPQDLDNRYWRVWGAIVRRARSETAGDIDMDEINKMFGWNQ
jgi:hypothetical protein